MMTVN